MDSDWVLTVDSDDLLSNELVNEINPREGDSMEGRLLGPEFSDEEIKACLDSVWAVYTRLSYEVVITRTAELLAQEKVIGWFQGRMDLAPRP